MSAHIAACAECHSRQAILRRLRPESHQALREHLPWPEPRQAVERRRSHPSLPEEEGRGAEVPDAGPDPVAQLERARRHERLVAAVSRRPGPQRLAVLLHLEGLSHREIAVVQGIILVFFVIAIIGAVRRFRPV